MIAAIKKAVVAALAAGVTVFFRELPREQEKVEREGIYPSARMMR
jgi:hypothetical protein